MIVVFVKLQLTMNLRVYGRKGDCEVGRSGMIVVLALLLTSWLSKIRILAYMQHVTPMHARKAALAIAFGLKDSAKHNWWMHCCHALTLFCYALLHIFPAKDHITKI